MDPDGGTTWNPFVHTRSYTRASDEEAVLSRPERVHSEACAEDPIKYIRHPEQPEYPSALRAFTAPVTDSKPEEESNSGDVMVETSAPEAEGPRKRRFGIYNKKVQDDAQLRRPWVAISNPWISLIVALFASVPVGFAVNYTHQSPVIVFCVNFIAIIPSAITLGYGVEQLRLRSRDIFAGLMNMTFSNAVQLISSVLLLKSRQISVLQFYLLGSILSNLLLMTGLAFLLGGIIMEEQYFNAAVAQSISMFLFLAALSLVIPTASGFMSNASPSDIIAQSRGTSIIIMISYGLWTFFQLKTNRSMFNEDNNRTPKGKRRRVHEKPRRVQKTQALLAVATSGATMATTSGGAIGNTRLIPDKADKIPKPTLPLIGAVLILLISIVLLGFNTEFATNSIQGLLREAGLSQAFVGIVIMPILSNDPTSIVVVIQDKMDMSIALTLERCMQTALMVIPLVVLLAWCMGIDDMSLKFDAFAISALFASIIIVTYVVQEGKSNWLTGALLIKVYVIISLAAFFIRP